MAKIEYELSMPSPQTHYFHVKMKLNNVNEIKKDGKIQVKMAVWTPGSYLVREYAKNVEGFQANAESKKLDSKKISKNTWEISVANEKEITVEYDVYAYELTVRTSFLDDSHGYINGASVFMYVNDWKNKPASLKIIPFSKWEKVSTALKETGKFTYQIQNLDELIDSPIEIGNHEILTFESMGVKHTIANYSNQKLMYDEKELIETYKKVVEASASVVGEHPCKEYLFIVHHLPNIGGGLEHLYSTTCQTSPNAYLTDKSFKDFMALIAHEYFHLWNVKRIRPIVLGPFDYENENYTTMLWVAEGFTSYYQDDIIRRAGITSEEEYFKIIASEINSIENQPGQRVQSVSESSMDAWIKFYRPNENSANSTISYYSKGGVIAMLLNIEILSNTKGEKSLDDVFKYLWKVYYKEKGRGFTDEEFKDAVELINGKSLDEFYAKFINGTAVIDYDSYFKKAGIEISNYNENKNEPFVGLRLNGARVLSVTKGSGAYESGINVNDEIVEVDNKPFNSIEQLSTKKVGETVSVKVKRSGQFFTYEVTLKRNPYVNYVLQPVKTMTKEQEVVYKKFMHSK